GTLSPCTREGKGLADDEILRLEPMLTDSLLQDLACNLQEIGLLRRDERGEWLLARDLEQVSLSDLYECTQLRIPVAEQHLPYRDDTLAAPHWRPWTTCDCPCASASSARSATSTPILETHHDPQDLVAADAPADPAAVAVGLQAGLGRFHHARAKAKAWPTTRSCGWSRC
ncbi:hypothetical protein ACQXYE_11865, partial [Corynebacterium diphtheriae]